MDPSGLLCPATLEPIVLRDGAHSTVRPITPASKPLIAAAMARLSPESIRRRFFAPRRELSERELDRLTALDGWNRYALGACARAAPTGRSRASASRGLSRIAGRRRRRGTRDHRRRRLPGPRRRQGARRAARRTPQSLRGIRDAARDRAPGQRGDHRTAAAATRRGHAGGATTISLMAVIPLPAEPVADAAGTSR